MKFSSIRRVLKRRSTWAVLYAIYLALILLSVHTLIAEVSVQDVRDDMDEKYTYYLTFEKDGKKTHYDVTRHNTAEPGSITLIYWTQDNKLEVTKVDNIKTLKIDVKSMFEDEANKVFKRSSGELPDFDMDYWLEAGDGVFTITFDIPNNEPIQRLTFTRFPTPTSVLVNNQEWWKTNTNYQVDSGEITISNLPTGSTTVIIYFKEANKVPIASFTTNPAQYAGVNEQVSFDGSGSSDPDGAIDSWTWDFGDGGSGSGVTSTHKYSKPGTYRVRLTVRDDAVPFAEAFVEKNLTVAYGAEDDFDGDGLRDKWEWENFGDLDETAAGDPDGDGASNLKEYEASTDPNDSTSFPEKTGGDKEESNMTTLLIIIAVIVVIVIMIPLFMNIMKAKKAREQDEAAIAEMEEKIAKAKKLGLPTRDMERMLKEAKEGKGLNRRDEEE